MLKVACKHYLKSMGDKSFVPNPDFPEFNSATCLDVVIKRKPKWFWQRPVYTYDNFGLNDLIDVPLPDDISQYLKKPEPLSPDYSWVSQHHIKSEMGSKIASLVSLDVEGDDTISLSIDLKDVVKQSINFSAVQRLLSEKKVNLKGKYISRLAQDKYNVVCIVSQFIYINKPLNIKVTVNEELKGSGDVSKLKYSVKDNGSITNNITKSLVFDVGTKIAFEFAECLISPDGTIELIDRSDHLRGKQMIPNMPKLAVLPNYCAHITLDGGNFDMPDSSDADNIVELFKSLSIVLIHTKLKEIKIHLLSLALENKNIFTKLELFLTHCLQETVDREIDMEKLMIFDQKMLENASIKNFLKDIGIPLEGPKVNMKATSLDKSLLEGILCLMQFIYQLEVPLLTNINTILTTYKASMIGDLMHFLLSLKFLGFLNKTVYERLNGDRNMRHLLRTIGVSETDTALNRFFEPILALLYDDY